MVITEPWCGDSAFLLPVIAKASALDEHVTLRNLLRDDNLDIMDQYLTGGSRSIPKLVAFSAEGEELCTWGPRPEEAANRVQTLREEYDDKRAVISALIDFYEEGGWQNTDEELAELVRASVAASSPVAES